MRDLPDRASLVAEILRQAEARGRGRTLCPSEVARALADDWRPLMPSIRAEAARLAKAGHITVTQKGVAVDPTKARGPIRLGLPTKA